jgi:hypothetical protein
MRTATLTFGEKSDDLIDFLVFNATFSYIMATSFSGGGSRSIRREPPTLRKQKECKGGQFKKTFERQVVVFHYL